MRQPKNIGIRVPAEVHWKLRSISEYEGRSMNGLVMAVIRAYVREFERLHGPIELPKGTCQENGK